MEIAYRFVRPIKLRLLSLFFLVIPLFGFGAETEPVVSLVSDFSPGNPASHGLTKLTAALHTNRIACEKVGSVDKAKG